MIHLACAGRLCSGVCARRRGAAAGATYRWVGNGVRCCAIVHQGVEWATRCVRSVSHLQDPRGPAGAAAGAGRGTRGAGRGGGGGSRGRGGGRKKQRNNAGTNDATFFKTGWTILPQRAEMRIQKISEFKKAFLDCRALITHHWHDCAMDSGT